MDLDLTVLWDSVIQMGETFLALVPRIIIGLLVMFLFVWLARVMRSGIQRLIKQAGRSEAAATALGGIARWLTIIVGILVAMTIIFPSVDVATLLGTLGVSGVVIGFAFRDILQNFFAGLILLLTEPFKIGDQIVIDDFEGTVKDIAVRATTIHTYDGRHVIIPNSNLFTDAVTVNTAHPIRRTQYDVGIGYGDDIDTAQRLILEALQATPGVLEDPAPDVLLVALADSTVNLRARWWADSNRADTLKVQDLVLQNIKERLVAAGIDLPFPTQMVLFHDQTEATDGNRALQREGWPAVPGQEPPQPARLVDRASNGQTGPSRTGAS
ncbi:MAG: mechanosensitive ion channel [Candidatus Promineifilaceae bacterium]|nr:mechanosensitive ion channel [Candidatus Promineifilaceae bacterium]